MPSWLSALSPGHSAPSWMGGSGYISDCLAPSSRLCVALAAWRPPHHVRPSGCLTPSLAIRYPHRHRSSHGLSALSSLLSALAPIRRIPRCPAGAPMVTRPALPTLRHPGYSASFRGFSAPSYSFGDFLFAICPLAIRYPQLPSWPLLTLLAARRLTSGWPVVGTYIIVWHSSGCPA